MRCGGRSREWVTIELAGPPDAPPRPEKMYPANATGNFARLACVALAVPILRSTAVLASAQFRGGILHRFLWRLLVKIVVALWSRYVQQQQQRRRHRQQHCSRWGAPRALLAQRTSSATTTPAARNATLARAVLGACVGSQQLGLPTAGADASLRLLGHRSTRHTRAFPATSRRPSSKCSVRRPQ